MGWTIKMQEQGEEVVAVKAAKGIVASDGKWIPATSRGFKALLEPEGGNSLMNPIRVSFSERWISKTDGMEWKGKTVIRCPKTGKSKEVKTKPDERMYFLRGKIIVVASHNQFHKEQRTGKQCTTKVTQHLPLEECDNGVRKEEDGTLYKVVEDSKWEYDLNKKPGKMNFGPFLRYMAKEYGKEVTVQLANEMMPLIQA